MVRPAVTLLKIHLMQSSGDTLRLQALDNLYKVI